MKTFTYKYLVMTLITITLLSCSKKEDRQQTELIDSTTVGKDTTSMDVRRDIKLSDENKRVLPDEAAEPTKSDERTKPD